MCPQIKSPHFCVNLKLFKCQNGLELFSNPPANTIHLMVLAGGLETIPNFEVLWFEIGLPEAEKFQFQNIDQIIKKNYA